MSAEDPGIWKQLTGWLWGLLVPAGWWIVNRFDREIDKRKDVEAKLFDEQRDIRREMNEGFTAVRQDISDKHIALLSAIHGSHK